MSFCAIIQSLRISGNSGIASFFTAPPTWRMAHTSISTS
jgi:hypothetical protein